MVCKGCIGSHSHSTRLHTDTHYAWNAAMKATKTQRKKLVKKAQEK